MQPRRVEQVLVPKKRARTQTCGWGGKEVIANQVKISDNFLH
jgi:hypothetical protein